MRISGWSSDVCSSDLFLHQGDRERGLFHVRAIPDGTTIVGRGYAPDPGSGPGHALRQSAGDLHGEAVQAPVLPDQRAAGDGDAFTAGEGLPAAVCSCDVGFVILVGPQHRAVYAPEVGVDGRRATAIVLSHP